MGDTEQTNGPVTGEEAPEKTAKQLKKEAEKAAKLEKLKAKLEKKSAVSAAPKESKDKPEKKKAEPPVSAVYNASTAPGEKKDVSGVMPDAYSPQYVEAAWYDWWDKQGFFKPEYGRDSILNVPESQKFVMMIPPPNVTGSLHLGHALTNAVEDCLARWNRMQGKMVLWNPGCDHAGIATQVVVEKKIWREEKKTRHELGREEFVKRVWDWKNQKGERIYEQLRALGSSFDWQRARFTMDPAMCRAVTEAFVRLHDSGDIYRASRLVNWSCSLKSAISDIEVDKRELAGRTLVRVPGCSEQVEVGVLVSFAYELADGVGEVVVATTRVETMLGDSAVAVHPEDARYKDLVGKKLKHPFVDREMPIIADAYVDKEFGTGAVKITPAHDPNDYEMGKRHNLPFVNILEDDGTIVSGYRQFSGLHRYAARRAVLAELDRLGLHRGSESHAMVLPICSRSKDIVEPMLKPQWYVKCDTMAEKAAHAVRSGELRIVPQAHEKTWFHWLDGIRDWCISRQLWWGHRIPAYRITVGGAQQSASAATSRARRTHSRTGRRKNARVRLRRSPVDVCGDACGADVISGDEMWVSAHSEAEARTKAAQKLKVDVAEVHVTQDPDVLDTWFSSALFPFSSQGWPDNTEDLQAFYPGTLLETGHDILFFWVARMVFMGQKLLGKLPFKTIFLHPMVRDAHGRKMSKSLGNVVDPTDVIRGISLEKLQEQLLDSNLDPRELDTAKKGQQRDYPSGIPECGTDALRFALCAMTQGRDLNLDILRVQGYRFFCNKLWNATKFALMYFPQGETYEVEPAGDLSAHGDMERWLLSRAANATRRVGDAMAAFDLPAATSACHSFWLYDLCDVYLEYVKPVFSSGSDAAKASARRALYTALDLGLRLLSPFMPFITEELYQRLPRASAAAPSICVARYPTTQTTSGWRSEQLEGDVDTVLQLVHAVRSTRTDYGLANKQRTVLHLSPVGSPDAAAVQRLTALLERLAGLAGSDLDRSAAPGGCALLPLGAHLQAHLVLEGLVDPEKETAKVQKKREQTLNTVKKLEEAAAAADYETKVPPEVRVGNSDKLTAAKAELDRLAAALELLSLIKTKQ